MYILISYIYIMFFIITGPIDLYGFFIYFLFPQIKSLKRRKALTTLTLGQDLVSLQWGNWWKTGRVTYYCHSIYTSSVCVCVYYQTWEPASQPQAQWNGAGSNTKESVIKRKRCWASAPRACSVSTTHNTHSMLKQETPRAETRGP